MIEECQQGSGGLKVLLPGPELQRARLGCPDVWGPEVQIEMAQPRWDSAAQGCHSNRGKES